MIQAVYDDEGRLIKADRKSVSAPYSKEFEPEIGKNNKLMFWNSIGEMEPLAQEPEEVFIESVAREHTNSLKNVDGKNATRLKLEISPMYDAAYGFAGGEFIKWQRWHTGVFLQLRC